MEEGQGREVGTETGASNTLGLLITLEHPEDDAMTMMLKIMLTSAAVLAALVHLGFLLSLDMGCTQRRCSTTIIYNLIFK